MEEAVWHHDDSLTEPENNVTEPPPLLALLLMPRILITIINYGFLGFCDLSVTTLTPLMWSTHLEHGGLGFTPYTIGLSLAVYGILGMLFQALAVGTIVRHFGPRKVFIGGIVTFIAILFCFPLEGYLARCTGNTDWRVWIVIMVHLVLYTMSTASYSKSNFLLLLPDNLIILVSCDSGFGQRQCAKPIFPWLCEWFGSDCIIRFKVPGTHCCVIIIRHLTAAKLGWWERSLLHINRYHGLWDATFFHAARGATVNIPFRDVLYT